MRHKLPDSRQEFDDVADDGKQIHMTRVAGQWLAESMKATKFCE
jgi:hypothetical protein